MSLLKIRNQKSWWKTFRWPKLVEYFKGTI